MKHFSIGLFALGVVLGGAAPTSAGPLPYSVQVGYADGLRTLNPDVFFPNPWAGSPGIIFAGDTSDTFDAGAIMITNTSAAPITINDVTVNGFANGFSYDLWGSNVIGVGQSLIVTQTAYGNFDTSDNSNGGTPGSPSTAIPQVIITADSTPTTFADTGHVLDTGGFDLAVYPSAKPGDTSGNESLNWRPIGTTGITNPGGSAVPEPASLTLFGLGTLGLLGYGWRRRKQTVATP